ncbi:MAG: hypothetical protein Ct9H300mP21_11120 [Pseudomonadota bacterium]|nr:MAG: hypothetical protein Ct9H300mP21_11120 [Pseudomonadota bacterium]
MQKKKKDFLEKIDAELGRFLGKWPGKLRLCSLPIIQLGVKKEFTGNDPETSFAAWARYSC